MFERPEPYPTKLGSSISNCAIDESTGNGVLPLLEEFYQSGGRRLPLLELDLPPNALSDEFRPGDIDQLHFPLQILIDPKRNFGFQ